MHLLHAKTGKIGFLPDVMSIYRKHSGGVWNGCGQSDDWFLRYGFPHMCFYREVEKTFNVNREDELVEIGQTTVNALLRNKKFLELENIAKEFPLIWDKLTCTDIKSDKKYRKLIKRNRRLKFILGFLLLIIICLIYCLI